MFFTIIVMVQQGEGKRPLGEMQKLLKSFWRLFHSNQVGCCFYFSFAAAAAVGDGTTISFENRKYGRRGLDAQKGNLQLSLHIV
jgi:hypothetical protein